MFKIIFRLVSQFSIYYCLIIYINRLLTAPIVASYIGLVVVWYENGLVHNAILDFIQQDWFFCLIAKILIYL